MTPKYLQGNSNSIHLKHQERIQGGKTRVTSGHASRILLLIIQVDIERVIEIITELQSGNWAE